MERPDGDGDNVNARLKIRKNSSSPSYLLLRGKSSGSQDNVAWASQGIFPVEISGNSASFQYKIEGANFNQGCSLRIIGYIE
jgi:hypothetical protein